MEQLTRYRVPILTAVGALVLAIIVYAAWTSPEGGKLSSFRPSRPSCSPSSCTCRPSSTPARDKAHLAANCQQLTTDLTEIPGTPTVDAFFNQVTALAVAAGDPRSDRCLESLPEQSWFPFLLRGRSPGVLLLSRMKNHRSCGLL